MMLHLLTKYLLQYKTVSIPHVGTIQIVQRPAQLDVADKRLSPPAFVAELKQNEEVPEHQLNFLETCLDKTKDDVLKDLKLFGDKLQEKINGPGFEWKGLGFISRSTRSVPLTIGGFEPIAAQKIARAGAEHQILVGDQQMTSVQMNERRTIADIVEEKKPWFVIAAWILLLLSILIIILFLYLGKFKVDAAGSKQKAISHISLFSNNFS